MPWETSNRAARLVGVPEQTVYSWARRGKLTREGGKVSVRAVLAEARHAGLTRA